MSDENVEEFTSYLKYRKKRHDIILKYGNPSPLVKTLNDKRINFSNFTIDTAKFSAYIATFFGVSGTAFPFSQYLQNYSNLPNANTIKGKLLNFVDPSLLNDVNIGILPLSLMAVTTSMYMLHSFTKTNKEFLKLDISKRNLYLEKFVSDIDVKNIEKRILKTPNDSDLMYLRLMNKLVINEMSENKEAIKAVERVMSIKNFFSSLKNFNDTLKIKSLSTFLDLRITKIIMNSNNHLALEGFLNKEKENFLSLKNRTIHGMSFVLNIPTRGSKIKVSNDAYLFDKINATDIELTMQEIYKHNENSLSYAYNQNLEQRLVLKFCKMLSESCSQGIFPENKLLDFEKIINAGKCKIGEYTSGSSVENNILNTIRIFKANPKKFISDKNNHSITYHIKKIDSSMIHQGKMIFRSFEDIFKNTRDILIYKGKNDLDNEINKKLKGDFVTIETNSKNVSVSENAVIELEKKEVEIIKQKNKIEEKRKKKLGF